MGWLLLPRLMGAIALSVSIALGTAISALAFGVQQVPDKGVKKGGHFTLFFRPPVPPNCVLRIRVNSHSITPGNAVGDLKAIGFGATTSDPNTLPATTATFEALKDNPDATVTFELFCPPDTKTPQTFDYPIGRGIPPLPSRPAIYKPEEKGPAAPKSSGGDVAGPKSDKDPFDGK